MGKFSADIINTYVLPEKVAVFWAGQAGFIIKTPKNKLIALDLYLSDCCRRYFGFKRIMPYLLEPHELKFDLVIASHGHYDHFDVDAIPMLLDEDTKFLGAVDTKAECDRLGLKDNLNFIKCTEEFVFDDIKIKGVPCDHGDLAPDALGLWIEVGNKSIYYMGDTAYRSDLFENEAVKGADILIAPINGMFGNLNSEEAACAAQILKPGVTVPCHFWNFAQHEGNPNEFINAMEERNLNYKVLRMGEGIVV